MSLTLGVTFVAALAQVHTLKPNQSIRLFGVANFCFPAFIVPPALRELRSFATLSRSLGLLNDFGCEQTDPDIFYGHLAEDTIGLLEGIAVGANASVGTTGTAGSAGAGGTSSSATTNTTLRGKHILDVGGSPGYSGRAFAQRGVEYYTCEPDVGEMAATGIKLESSVCGSGLGLPFHGGASDLTYSSNVTEHVPGPWTMGEEMLCVTKPGGLVVYSYTIWYGPFGGHEMGMTYYLSGGRARRMYEKEHDKRPRSYFGESLSKVGYGGGLKWARAAAGAGDCKLLTTFPRYHPWWAWRMTHVPVLHEFAVSNLVPVLRKQ